MLIFMIKFGLGFELLIEKPATPKKNTAGNSRAK